MTRPHRPPVRHLDLFSGIGGFALAARMVGGIETVAFCEIDPWAQQVLTKNFPNVPIHGDVKTLNPKDYGRIDLITGGYPCQPFSHAGKRKGERDERHLWPAMYSRILAARPRWVLAENVDGHITMGLDQVLSDLEMGGYTSGVASIPACAVGAGHVRKRTWLFAHANRERRDYPSEKPTRNETESELGKKHEYREPCGVNLSDWERDIESAVGREFHGLPNRVDRLRGLGNAIVPQVAAEILRCMMRVDSLHNNPIRPPQAGCDASSDDIYNETL